VSFEVDPAGLRGAGNGLTDVGGQFGAALEAFRAKIAGHGEPWGADDLGTLVALSFPVVAGYLLECCDAIADEYEVSGADLAGMADDYEAVEQELEGQFRRIGEGLG
jgi:hypothetical protein